MANKKLNLCDLNKLWKDPEYTEPATRVAVEQQDFICNFNVSDYLHIELSMITGIACLEKIGSLDISSNNGSILKLIPNTGDNEIEQINCEQLLINSLSFNRYFKNDSIESDYCSISGSDINVNISSLSSTSGLYMQNVSGTISEIICDGPSYISGVDQEANIEYLKNSQGALIYLPVDITGCEFKQSNLLLQDIPDSSGYYLFRYSPLITDTTFIDSEIKYESGGISFINSLNGYYGAFVDTNVTADVVYLKAIADTGNLLDGEEPNPIYGGYGYGFEINGLWVNITNYSQPQGLIQTENLVVNNFEYLDSKLQLSVASGLELTTHKVTNEHNSFAFGTNFTETVYTVGDPPENRYYYENTFYTGVPINLYISCPDIRINGKEDIYYELDEHPDKTIIGHYNYALLMKDIQTSTIFLNKVANYGTLTVSKRAWLNDGVNFGKIKLASTGTHLIDTAFKNLGTIEYY